MSVTPYISRQLQRACARVLMARIRPVINDVHAVQTHDVVREGFLLTVIVVPERAHLFPGVTDAVPTRVLVRKSLDAGVDIRVEMVFISAAWEKVTRETIAL